MLEIADFINQLGLSGSGCDVTHCLQPLPIALSDFALQHEPLALPVPLLNDLLQVLRR